MLKYHPAADLFPLLQGPEFDALTADIRERGLRESLVLYDGKLLDGRNRYRACQELKIKARTREFTGGDPLAYVISANLHRRHLSESQRGLVAAKLANMRQGERTDLAQTCAKSQTEAAKLCHVSRRTAQSARAVREHGVPELVAACEADTISVSVGAKIAELSAVEQRAVVAAVVKGAKPSAALRAARKRIAKKRAPELPDGKYRVLYADPPWCYSDKCDAGAIQSGGCEKHYPAMTIDELCTLPVAEAAEDNAVLFLWVTSPLLAECWPVIEVWGFTYKTSFIWYKVKHNMGHYNSVRHELLLLCTRGSCLPDSKTLIDSVQTIERSAKHSEKPEEFRRIIETMYDHGARLELFARGAHAGWDGWGDQVDVQ